MTPDQLLVTQCLKKKRLSHVEADIVLKSIHTGGHGRRKGKKRKRDKDMTAYECWFCGHWHIGHPTYKTKYDPALRHRKAYEREQKHKQVGKSDNS